MDHNSKSVNLLFSSTDLLMSKSHCRKSSPEKERKSYLKDNLHFLRYFCITKGISFVFVIVSGGKCDVTVAEILGLTFKESERLSVCVCVLVRERERERERERDNHSLESQSTLQVNFSPFEQVIWCQIFLIFLFLTFTLIVCRKIVCTKIIKMCCVLINKKII